MEVHERADGRASSSTTPTTPTPTRCGPRSRRWPRSARGRGRAHGRRARRDARARRASREPSTTRSAGWPRASASTSARGRRRGGRGRSTGARLEGVLGRASRSSRAGQRRGARPGCARMSPPATWCWSRRRAARRSRRSPTALLAEATRPEETRPMRAILLGGGLALLISPCSAPGSRSGVLVAKGLRPGDPRRRTDHPPHQARHAHHGRRSSSSLGHGARLLRRQADHRRRAVARRRCCCCSCSSGWAWSASSTTTSRSPSSAASACAARPRWSARPSIAVVVRLPRAVADGSRTTAARPRPRTTISFIRDDRLAGAARDRAASLLIWLIIAGTSNAVNLTDGLDGLATGASMMVFGAYTLVNIWQNNQCVRARPGRQAATRCATRSTSPSSPPRSPAPASASCGGTPRRPRSSWATPARCRSAARSPGSRS